MDSTNSQTPPEFLLVGVGASAGGIEALQTFFAHAPPSSAIAYVVILHLSPAYDSQLAAILQTVTPIPVTALTARVRVEPNHVYVVAPNQHLTMVDGEIAVSPNTLPEERSAPIDIFFRTLAESHEARAACVILSGTGADGSMGLKRVKERGGAVFVQNPREARFNEMPRSAIATDLVDDVLPVADIPARLVAYAASLGTVAIPVDPEERPAAQQQALRELFVQLRTHTGHDFANYKRATLLRRIERRINVRSLPDLPAYAAFVSANPDEVHSLLKDLLISVTNFFRDKAAFTALERDVLPRIFRDRRAGEQVRLWVVGCATGEEAYSLAMLCAEQTADLLDAPSVQIFASDIDEDAIAHAREGLYHAAATADVSPERLRRFFTVEDNRYRVRRELRELVLFANQNVLKDPPFSHLDLATCRNVLIYLNHTAQERVMETLHFALRPNGYLFLGTSEGVDGAANLFTPVNREQRIFQRVHSVDSPPPLPEVAPALRARPLHLPLLLAEGSERGERVDFGDLHQRLLEAYAPPSVVVNQEYDLVHLSERAGRYLQITGGTLSANLLTLVRPELRLELRTALYQALQRQANVDVSNLPVRIDNQTELVTIRVRPVLYPDSAAEGFLLVLFEPGASPLSDAEPVLRADEPMAQQLEAEVVRLRLQLRTSSEQYEFQAEELKATNEELQALNEELRSSSEELETSKEELQSINEELRTVNQELKVKVEEATLHSTNLQNLVNSADVGTLFLDRGLRVKLFTPAARALFNLIPADYGRPLSDITHRLADVDVLYEAAQVLATLQTIEREVRATNGRVYMLRVLPYRAAEDRIGGVVLTFFDVTERTRAEALVTADLAAMELLHTLSTRLVAEGNLEVLYDEIQATAIALVGADAGTVQILDEATQELVLLAAQGFDATMTTRFQRVDARSTTSCGIALATGERTLLDFDLPDHQDPDGSLRLHAAAGYHSGQSTPLITRSGRPIGMVSTHWRTRHRPSERELRLLDLLARQAADLLDRRRTEQALRASETRYRTLFTSIDEAFALCEILLDANGAPVDYRLLEVNPAFEQMTGITPAMAAGKTARELIPGIEEWWIETYGRVALQGEPIRFENRVAAMDRWFDAYAAPVGEPGSGKFALVFKDITERKRTDARLREIAALDAFRVTLSDRLRPLADPAAIQGEAGRLLGERLGVDRAYYAEINAAEQYARINQNYLRGDSPSLVGAYPLADYGWTLSLLQRGETVTITDADNAASLPDIDRAAMAAIRIAAYITVPLVKAGSLVGALCVTECAPREWSHTDIDLVRETAERIWATIERARAELRFQQLYVQEQAARAEVEEASRLKDEFLATVSHELRTPLTAFLGYAQLLQHRNRDESYIALTVERMVRSAKAQATLIEDLLDVSRIVSGKLRIEPEPVDLIAVVHAAIDTVRPTLEAKGLQLQLALDPAAGAVLGDTNRLQQVIWNLLANATKFTPTGGQITVRLAHEAGQIELVVSDTGQGITPDFLPYVFDRFRQGDSSNRRSYGGLGLGLAIVRHLVELHGGTATAASGGINQGATFTVRLPPAGTRPLPGQRSPPIAAEGVPDAGHFALDGLRVLVVDDQPVILELLAEMLALDGAMVRTCATAADALALLRDWRPDVLISDLAMPNEDGYWLIEQVRGLAPQEGGATPAAALTAYVRMEDRLRVMAAGFQQYIPKPVDPTELRDVVAHLAALNQE